MSKKTEDWNDIVEDTDNIDKSGTNNPNKNDDIVSTTTTSKPSRSAKADKPDKPNKPNKPDKTDKTDTTDTTDTTEKPYKKKYYPHIPCWFLVNSYQCKQSECWFNHNPELVKEHKQKRERKVCHMYLRCDKRCNKYHNMDELMELYNSANNKLETISSIMKS
jgi:hypothetical protein